MKSVILVVLDGFGIPPRGAVSESPFKAANKPTIHYLEQWYLFTTLQASGIAVGLPFGKAGNSEVGHLTMGAGRILYHHLPRIITAIEDKSFFQNKEFLAAVRHVEEQKSTLHLMGLFSNGSVHAYRDHFYALVDFAGMAGVPTMLHLFSDGKDAPTREFAEDVRELLRYLEEKQFKNIHIASIIGRFYAMDRDQKWERVKEAYECLTGVKGAAFTDPAAYAEHSYEEGIEDEFLKPAWNTGASDNPLGRVRSHDAVILWNFREDSIREITQALQEESFEGFRRECPKDLFVVTMTKYSEHLPVRVAFPPIDVVRPLAAVLSENNRTQFHIAETQKYAHVTYFFNGGIEEAYPGEERLLVPSQNIKHFSEHPEMSASQITQKVLEEFPRHDFTLANFANPDIVGHTGNYEATVKAVEIVDSCLKELMEKILLTGGTMVITGDHGNAEEKYFGLTGRKRTEHTTNVVPFFLVGKEFQNKQEKTDLMIAQAYQNTKGTLADVAPTILGVLNIEQPSEMTGVNLLPKLLQNS